MGNWAYTVFLHTQFAYKYTEPYLEIVRYITAKPPFGRRQEAKIKFINFTVQKHLIKRNTAKVRWRLWNNQSISHFLSNGVLKNSLYFYIALRICIIGGSKLNFFGISMGIKRRMLVICKKYFFYFCKMFHNAQFFAFAFKVCKKCY